MVMSTTVKSYLEGRGINYETLTHPETGSSHESARVAGIDQGHIAKAVMLQDDTGEVMVVIPGDSWVRLAAVNHELGREMALAPESASSAPFPDCEAGAMPPLGPAYGLETLLDEALCSLAFVYFESGDHRTLVRVSGPDFQNLLSGVRHGHFSEAS